MKTLDADCLNWMRSRPPAIKALMVEFPPACVVKLNSDAPLCKQHRRALDIEYQVIAYNEDGMIGIAPKAQCYDVAVQTRRYVFPDHIEVVEYIEGQTPTWVKAMCGSET